PHHTEWVLMRNSYAWPVGKAKNSTGPWRKSKVSSEEVASVPCAVRWIKENSSAGSKPASLRICSGVGIGSDVDAFLPLIVYLKRAVSVVMATSQDVSIERTAFAVPT